MARNYDLPWEKWSPLTALAYVGTSGGALSYGLSKLTDFDLIAEVSNVIGTSPELGAGAFALVGGVALAADFGVVDLEE